MPVNRPKVLFYRQQTGTSLLAGFREQLAAPLGFEDYREEDGFWIREPGKSRHWAYEFRMGGEADRAGRVAAREPDRLLPFRRGRRVRVPLIAWLLGVRASVLAVIHLISHAGC